MLFKSTAKMISLALTALMLSACGSDLAPVNDTVNSTPTTPSVKVAVQPAANINSTANSNDLPIEQVIFTDAKLASCIESQAKTHGWKLASEVTTLDCSNKGIDSVGGTQNFSALKKLDLSHNKITVLTPLESLKQLAYLDLAANGIVDVQSLANLTALTQLNLGASDQLSRAGNNIRDISALANLTGLTELDLSHNQLSDVADLQNLSALNTLYLQGNQVRDINVLYGLRNTQLIDLGDNDNIDCAALNELEANQFQGKLKRPNDCIFTLDILLVDIHFSDLNLKNCVLDTASSEGWISINEVTSLACDQQFLTDLSGLQSLRALEKINLSSNEVIDIAPLFTLTSASHIDLSMNEQIACRRLDALQAVLTNTAITRPNRCAQITLISDLSLVDPALEACVHYTAELYQWHNIAEMTSLHCPNFNEQQDQQNKIKDLRGLDQLEALNSLHISEHLSEQLGCDDIEKLQQNLDILSLDKPIRCH
jgi:Leucine-rich repeat (LRR) protein